MPAVTQPRCSVEILLTRLHESHDVAAYEAVERLTRAAEAAGFDADTILGMFDRGMTLQKVLELIVSSSTRLQKAA